MTGHGLDLVALGPGAYMDWLLGFHPHPDERPCLLLIGAERETFVMPALNAEDSRQRTDVPLYTWSDEEGPTGALKAALEAVTSGAITAVAVDEAMRADFAMLLLDACPGAQRTYVGDTVGALRMRKDEAEYAELKMNAELADRAMETAFAALEVGMAEEDVADAVRASFVADGAKPLFLIVGTGANGAFPHHQTGPTVLKAGDAVVIDLGASKGIYSSDITRMAVLGELPQGYQRVHDTVERAVQAALEAAQPGTAAKEVDNAARTVITEAGYGDYFVHRTGHGLGVDIHEPPYLTSSAETVLEEGMVFSVEPGIYLPGRFGVRLEEIVILRAEGPEVLSSLERKAVMIG